MGWRLALSLDTLRAEFNAAFPSRSKVSDGTIGDPAHASRASRHNPNRHDVVTALDITHDPSSGCDVHAAARRLVRDPHPELAYIISNGQIASRPDFNWRSYGGSNPHTRHAHFAVGVGPDSDPRPPYDSTRPWGIASQEDEDMLTQGQQDPEGTVGPVTAWQHLLNRYLATAQIPFDGDGSTYGQGKLLNPDGTFGDLTVRAGQKVLHHAQTEGPLGHPIYPNAAKVTALTQAFAVDALERLLHPAGAGEGEQGPPGPAGPQGPPGPKGDDGLVEVKVNGQVVAR